MSDFADAVAHLQSQTIKQMTQEMRDAKGLIEEAKCSLLTQRQRIARLEKAMMQIHGHLGAAIVQHAAVDDPIIASHVSEADAIALRALHDRLEIEAPPIVAERCRGIVEHVMFGAKPRDVL